MKKRTAKIERKTKETAIKILLDLDGKGETKISTGLRFLDHMLSALGHHAGFNLKLNCKGDLDVDDHHTVEDCAISLGEAFNTALSDKKGIARFGSAYAPLDEALARAVVDISGRAHCEASLPLKHKTAGDVSGENLLHFFRSFASSAKITLHVDVIKGENDHHKAEAAFKALALAIKEAVALSNKNAIPSTKGVL